MVRDGKDGRRQRPSSLALSLSLAFSLTPDRVLISSTLSILLLCDPMLIAKLLMSALGPLIGEVVLTPPSVLYCFALPALNLLTLPLVPLLFVRSDLSEVTDYPRPCGCETCGHEPGLSWHPDQPV